jgi:hypothetical protein
MRTSLKVAWILTIAVALTLGAAAWAGDEETKKWVSAEGQRFEIRTDHHAMFIGEGDGENFDLEDLADGETQTFGEGEKQVTVSRLGDVVTIDRAARGEAQKLELKCNVATDSCQVITFEDNPEKVMIVVKKERTCIDGVGDCTATVDVMLDSMNLPHGAHAMIQKVECDDKGNCETFEDVQGMGNVKVITDFDGPGHGNVMVFHADSADGKTLLRCPEGDATVRVDEQEADDTFLCPKHSVPMEQVSAKKLIKTIRFEQADD